MSAIALFVSRIAVTPGAGRETPRAGFGLAALDGRYAAPEFVQHRLVPAETPLLDRREPVAAQCHLRQPSQFLRQLLRGSKRLPGCNDAIGETDAFGFLTGDAAAGQDQVHGAAMADQP